jgi:diadenosine tetraphosphate (Ap4A) HIT family hydrolase
MKFELDPRLANDGSELLDLDLSKVILVNNALFPWLILVPKRNNIKEIIDLNQEDRSLLMEEINLISIVMKEIFSPDKLNVAALGNVVPQLHIHIIARYNNDLAWPEPVFGKGKKAYTPENFKYVSDKVKELINIRQ